MIRKISDIFKEKEKTLGFEFFPPKTPKGLLKLYETAHLLKDLQPDYCSVTYGAGGNTKDRTMEVVDELQKRFGYSKDHLNRIFKKHQNMTIKHFIMINKIERASKLLEITHTDIKTITFELGFSVNLCTANIKPIIVFPSPVGITTKQLVFRQLINIFS